MSDPSAVQPAYFGPQPQEQLVADRLRWQVDERSAVHSFHGQQRRPAASSDDPYDTRDLYAGPLGRHADKSLALDRPDGRGGGPGVAHVAQPGKSVHAVKQVRVTLVRAQCLDEQPPPVITDRHERPGTFRPHTSRLDDSGGQAGGLKRFGDPIGAHAVVGHAERHQNAGPHRYPDGECEEQFDRQNCAGDQPGPDHGAEHEPSRPAPRTAQPRRHGDRYRRRRGEKGRAWEPSAGQPRAMTGNRRHRRRVLVGGQVQDC